MVVATAMLAYVRITQFASILGVGGVIVFSLGVIIAHMEP
jgi:hypothetical protein